MALTSEVIYDIREELKKYSDDSKYDDRHILYLCNIKRAKFLRQLLEDKTRGIDNILIQSFCIGFMETSTGLCGVDVGCTVMKSIQPIPQLLEVKNRNTLISIQPSIALSKPFKVIDMLQAPYILDKKYSNGIYATVDTDNYIYLISRNDEHRLIDCLFVTAVFESPSDLEDYTNCCDCENTPSCFDVDTKYPAQGFIIDLVRDEVVKLLTGAKERMKEDKDNNADDE